ncbi:MerR family transcriptional regulator [Aquirhabdus sp.]|uniref:MerR family transcriptional regulator n=1 Tax=Aquirhabdus sp. TaxID=2824160 RepID=UPI00396D03B0
MKIGELAKRTGLAASRIRFYEASGLIQVVERKANGYREYPSEAVWMLEIITRAQSAGFSLDEIRHLLPTPQNTWKHDELLEGLKHKVTEIEALQKRLEYNKTQLLVVIETIDRGMEDIPCVDRPTWILNRMCAGLADAPVNSEESK